MCAITNDCSSIIDHLDDLEAQHTEIAASYPQADVDVEPCRVLFNEGAIRCIDVLHSMVFGDMKELFEQVSPATSPPRHATSRHVTPRHVTPRH